MLSLILTAFAAPVQLFLQNPLTHDAPADRCEDAHCVALLDHIQAAERSIEFAVYGFRDQSEIMRALVEARDRGVRVRGVVDVDVANHNYYTSTEAVQSLLEIHTDYHSELENASKERTFRGARPACKRPTGFDGPLQCLDYDLGDSCVFAAHAARDRIEGGAMIQHNKFFVFDGTSVWTGSTNVSDSGTGGYNANLVVVVESVEVAGLYQAEFERMFEGNFHKAKRSRRASPIQLGSTQLKVLFSPQDKPIRRGVQPLIRRAKRSVDVAVFFLTHKEITRDLIAAHRRGVKVRVLLDATAAKNEYSKHKILRAAGIPVKVEDWGGKMHAKSAVIDGEVIVTGSMNWTSAGEGGNDENTILVRDRALAAQYQRWFDTVWESVDPRWLSDRPDPESPDSGSACTDGVDNDFDHLADADDPGCGVKRPPLPPLPGQEIVAKSMGEGRLFKAIQVDRRWVYLRPADPMYRTYSVDGEQVRWLCGGGEARAAGIKRAPPSTR